ncbi:MAG: alpha-E domain-containing protein [Hyphomicrobiaceae bacterium]|nr:alpha-E domain-containing protein [Hyphomicrobiaceae bacterium]
MQLLSRHAECLFWLGRYIERTSSLARILLVQTAFDRGRASGSGWSWLLTLFDDADDFAKRYPEPSSRNVIRYYLNDRENLGSVVGSLGAARANARALRAMVSTEFWMQINRTYRRVDALPSELESESRLAQTCEQIQTDCYALLGIAQSTFYRDAGWRFFELGLEIERADQMSRLLDVRFAQIQAGTAEHGDTLGDFTHWSMLLRACGGHHAFRRLVSGPLQPMNIAQFLIFEQSFARSIAHCAMEIDGTVTQLRTHCGLPTPSRLLKRISDLHDLLHLAQRDPGLVRYLHGFNDAVQRELIALTNDLAVCYFGLEDQALAATAATSVPSETTPPRPPAQGSQSQSQDQSQKQGQSQSQSQDRSQATATAAPTTTTSRSQAKNQPSD